MIPAKISSSLRSRPVLRQILDLIPYERILQICKYCIVGGLGAVIDFSVYSSLIILMKYFYLVANIFSFIIATVIVYYLQKNWTFRYRSSREIFTFSKYLSVATLTYLLNNVLLVLFVEIVQWNVLAAKIGQIGISFLWSFTVNNYFVFKKEGIPPVPGPE